MNDTCHIKSEVVTVYIYFLVSEWWNMLLSSLEIVMSIELFKCDRVVMLPEAHQTCPVFLINRLL